MASTSWFEGLRVAVLAAFRVAGTLGVPDGLVKVDDKASPGPLTGVRKILSDRAVLAPIWENGVMHGVGPCAEEPASSSIPAFPLLGAVRGFRSGEARR